MPAHSTTRRLPLFGLAALALVPGVLAPGARAQLAPTGQQKPSAAIPAGLPPTAPTTLPLQPVKPVLPGDQPAKRATVLWTQGQLTVQAENSSLNQILRAISRETGLKITGGVTDERVYGTYGPAEPARILNTLLDGTGSNMLLVESTTDAPAELILTPRHGGVTPPNPNAGIAEDRDEEQERPRRPEHQGPDLDLHGGNPPAGGPPSGPPPGAPAASAAASTSSGASDSGSSTGSSSGSSTTTDQSPNGVKTPQQIYEQLLQMQQKKSASTTGQ